MERPMPKPPIATRSATSVAQALYDEPRDLEPFEQQFLADVHRIRGECARTKGEAARAWGEGSRACAAVAFLADAKCATHLARALARYDEAASVTEAAE
jgi:hypothetical protein